MAGGAADFTRYAYGYNAAGLRECIDLAYGTYRDFCMTRWGLFGGPAQDDKP
jgi:hypothetical protein